MPSPFVHVAVPGGCFLSSLLNLPPLNRVEKIRTLFLIVLLGNIPDWDVIPASIWSTHWDTIHRGWGHNLFVVGIYLYWGVKGLRWASSQKFSVKLALLLATLSVGSHFAMDSMAYENQEGRTPSVPLFYPFSNKGYDIPLKIFLCPEKDKHLHPFIGLASATSFWKRTLLNETIASAAIILLWWVTSKSLSFLFGLSLRKYNQARPLPLLPDGNPIRTYKDRESES